MRTSKLPHFYIPGYYFIKTIKGVTLSFDRPCKTLEDMELAEIRYQFKVTQLDKFNPGKIKKYPDKLSYEGLTAEETMVVLKQLGIPFPHDAFQRMKYDNVQIHEKSSFIELRIGCNPYLNLRTSFQFNGTLASYNNAVLSALNVRTYVRELKKSLEQVK